MKFEALSTNGWKTLPWLSLYFKSEAMKKNPSGTGKGNQADRPKGIFFIACRLTATHGMVSFVAIWGRKLLASICASDLELISKKWKQGREEER